MAYPVMDGSRLTITEEPEDIVETREYVYRNKTFLLVRDNEYGYWQVRHASNKQLVKDCPGYFTSTAAAIRSIQMLPESIFKPINLKTVYTPKVKDAEERGSSA